jgi:ribonuclease HII
MTYDKPILRFLSNKEWVENTMPTGGMFRMIRAADVLLPSKMKIIFLSHNSRLTENPLRNMSLAMCRHARNGVPMIDRSETVEVVSTLLGTGTSSDWNVSTTTSSTVVHANYTGDTIHALISNDIDVQNDESSVFGEGPLILSDIPTSSRGCPIVLGIDEAGRGSVVGPMIYGMCYWNANANLDDHESTRQFDIPKDFNDSKQLNEAQRNVLFDKILASNDIGFGIRILPASEISRNMLRQLPYNLNQMSHNAAISMIRALQQTDQVQIRTCYIDTVGNASSYQRRLEQEFPDIEFVVESKADDTYPPCSAASIGTFVHFFL